MIIQILDYQWIPKARLHEVSNFKARKVLNGAGMMSFGLSYDSLQIVNTEILVTDQVRVFVFTGDYNESKLIFSGYIFSVTPNDGQISFECKDWMEYCDHRLYRAEQIYNVGASVKGIISYVYDYINTIHPLPFALRLNDCTSTITEEIKMTKGASFADLLEALKKQIPSLEIRIVSDNTGSYMDVSLQTGLLLSGRRISDIQNPRRNTITERSRSSSAITAPTLTINDKGTVGTEMTGKLPFEVFVTEGKNPSRDAPKLPKIRVDVEYDDRRNIELWDRKLTSIITPTEWLNIDYTAIIQGISYNTSMTGIDVVVDIGEELGNQTNVLDRALNYLHDAVKYLIKKTSI